MDSLPEYSLETINIHALKLKHVDNNILFHKYYDELIQVKNKIDMGYKNNEREIINDGYKMVGIDKGDFLVGNWGNWDSVKKYTDDYALVYKPGKHHNTGIAYYIASSRAFYKMTEILQTSNVLNMWCGKEGLKVGCLAEGPGGFIEAIIKARGQKLSSTDNIFGITLGSSGSERTGNSPPDWDRLRFSIKKRKIKCNISLTYGNLYDIRDIKTWITKLGGYGSCHLITADGGIDYNNNWAFQEQSSVRLKMNEIFVALMIQREGGVFICKIFDIFTTISMRLIKLLCSFYTNVNIFKPNTSRPANSEKYLICTNFKRKLTIDEINHLLNMISNWKEEYNEIEGIELNTDYIHFMNKYNANIMKRQIDNINMTLNYLNNPPSLEEYNERLKYMIQLAIKWCKDNGEPLNYKSIYKDLF